MSNYKIGSNMPIALSLEDWVDPDLNELTADIYLSRDNGGSYSLIAAGVANNTTYSWPVSAPASASCKLQFRNSLNAAYTATGNLFGIIASATESKLSIGVGIGI